MAQAARERPGVYRTSPNLFSLRLSDDQKARIEAAAKVRSKTASDLMRDGIMTYVIGIEEEERVKKKARVKAHEEAFVPRNPKSPRIGIGIPFIQPDAETSIPSTTPTFSPPTTTAPPPTPQQIVIQTVGTPTGAGRDDVDVLSNYLAGAKNIIERKERERTVDKIIRSSSYSVEDQKRIAKTLDERERIAKAADERNTTQPARSPWSWLK